MTEQYIPAGRTSVVSKGASEYQLQTEYARRPHPRITTTIFSQGRVLHKIERPLESEVVTLEQMHAAEEVIKAQHLEVAQILREKGLAGDAEQSLRRSEEKLRSSRIRRLPKVEKVYLVTSDGRLVGDKDTTDEFKRMFRHVLKGLPDLLKVFSALPGSGEIREEGIYEVEPGRIILASTGAEFYLILLNPGTEYNLIAPQIRDILAGK